MLGIVRSLVDELDAEEVCYVHFKSNEHIDESVIGKTDFDILVDRSSVHRFETVLHKLDFKRFISPERTTYPGVNDWLGMDPDTGSFIHLHTHYQLITGQAGYKNFVLPWGELALASRSKDPQTGLYFVSAEFEIIELYTRIIAKMNRIKDFWFIWKGYTLKGETLREVRWLWERLDADKLEQVKEQCFGDRAKELDTAVFRQECFTPAQYRALRSFMLDKLRCHQRAGMACVGWRSLWNTFRNRVRGKLRKLRPFPTWQRKKFCNSGGLLIAVLGVDGSGKSTVSGEIASWLFWKMEVHRMGLGYGRKKEELSYKLKQKVKKLLKRSASSSQNTDTASLAPVARNRKNLRAQKKKVAFARLLRRDILRIHAFCLNGGIMVVDRYPQLQFAGLADGPKVNCAYPELQAKELEALSVVREIQPDLVFKLMVPVEVSLERRPEDSEEVLRRKYEILQAVDYPNAEIVEVDATQPLEQELLFIKKKIWEKL